MINKTVNRTLLQEISNSRRFKIAALNISSQHVHSDELRVYVNTKSIDILAINEIRLDETIFDWEISIPAYTLDRKDRNRHGGDVALYIRTIINYELICELVVDQLEWLCIKVTKPKTNPFIVGTCYRPPASTSVTITAFESLIERLELLGLETNIIGDFKLWCRCLSPWTTQ